MSEKTSTDQYGRKSWDVEKYAEDARNRGKTQKPETSIENPITEKSSSSFLEHREKLLQTLLAAVKSENLINPLNVGVYGKNKRFGFFCTICDLSFRDNLALIDHFNSSQHVNKALQLRGPEEDDRTEGGIHHAKLEEVVKTIEQLVAQQLQARENEEKSPMSFLERVEKRKQFEREKAARRKEKIQRRKARRAAEEAEGPSEVEAVMSFSGFGSTKK